MHCFTIFALPPSFSLTQQTPFNALHYLLLYRFFFPYNSDFKLCSAYSPVLTGQHLRPKPTLCQSFLYPVKYTFPRQLSQRRVETVNPDRLLAITITLPAKGLVTWSNDITLSGWRPFEITSTSSLFHTLTLLYEPDSVVCNSLTKDIMIKIRA